METIKCIRCGLIKELIVDNFYFRNDSQKWNNVCKKCISIGGKKKYEQKSEEIKKKVAIYREANKTIINNKAAIYNSKQETKDRTVKWRQENRKQLRKKEKEWRLKNPDKYKEIVFRKSKKQRQKPTSKIKAHVSRQVNFALHRTGNSKQGNSVLKFLSYTIQELKGHLEKQFEPWMMWSNYGIYRESSWIENDQSTWTWQIDHIIPQSDLPFSSMEEENFQKCWSLSNLRPLSAKQNIMDGSNRIRHK
jgi:hypothetical protein